MLGGTVIIDNCAEGGSDAGAWLTHIAHTPALRAQCNEDFPGAQPSGRTDSAPIAVRSVTQTGGTGGTVTPSPACPTTVPPAFIPAGRPHA